MLEGSVRIAMASLTTCLSYRHGCSVRCRIHFVVVKVISMTTMTSLLISLNTGFHVVRCVATIQSHCRRFGLRQGFVI